MQRINLSVLVVMLLLGCMQTHAIRINHITGSPQSVARACSDLQEAIECGHIQPAYAIAYKLAKLGCYDALGPYIEDLSELLPEHNVTELHALLEKKPALVKDRVPKKTKKPEEPVAVAVANSESRQRDIHAYEQLQNNYNAIFEQWCRLQQHQTEELELRAVQICELEEQLATTAKRAEQLESALQLMGESTVDKNDLKNLQVTLERTKQRSQDIEHALQTANEELQQQLQETRDVLQVTREQLEVAMGRPHIILRELKQAYTKNTELCEQLAMFNKESEQLCLDLHASKAEMLTYMDANNELQETLLVAQKQSKEQHAMYESIQGQLAHASSLQRALEKEYEEYRAHNNPESLHLFLGDMKRAARDKMINLRAVIDDLNRQHESTKKQFTQERTELVAECELYEQYIEKLCSDMEQERAAMLENHEQCMKKLCNDMEQERAMMAEAHEQHVEKICCDMKHARAAMVEEYEQYVEKLCADMKQERTAMTEKYDAAEQQCKLLACSNEALEEACCKLQSAVHDQTEARTELEEMLAQAKSQLAHAKEELCAQKGQWNALCNQFDQCCQENRALAELCEKEQAHGKKQACHIAELSETLSDLEQESRQLGCRYKDLVLSHRSLQAVMEEREEESEELLAALTEVQQDLQQEKQRYQNIQNDYVSLCEQLNECKQEKATLTQLCQQEQVRGEHKNERIAELSDRLLHTQDALTSLTQDLTAQRQQTQRLHAELADSTEKHATMEYQCKKLICEIERQQQCAEQKDSQRCQYIAELEASLHQQNCTADGLSHELIAVREQLAQTACQLEEQAHASNTLSEELRFTQEANAKEITYAHNRIADLTSELNYEKQGRERVHTNYENSVAQIASLEEQLQEYVQAYRAATEKNHRLALEAKAGLDRTMRVAQEKIHSLERERQTLHHELERAQNVQAQLQQKISDKDSHSIQLAHELEYSHRQITGLKQQLAACKESARTMEMQYASMQAAINDSEGMIAEQAVSDIKVTATA